MMDLAQFSDFETSSRAVLAYLHERLGFSLWMMTRVVGDDWIALQVEDHGYDVTDGSVFRWTDSFCCQMVKGHGPRVAANAQDVPVYAAAPIGQQIPIKAYLGVPVVRNDGSLFGTLCAIDPLAQQETIKNELPLVELLAKLLGTVLDLELAAVDHERELNVSRQEAFLDSLTGLLNRKGWDNYTTIEEARIKRYGESVSILILDLDDLKVVNDSSGHALGDQLLRKAASCIQSTLRNVDIVARIGGDEFAILAIDCNQAGLKVLNTKITKALTAQGITASIGAATHSPENDLSITIDLADQNMYTQKKARKLKA